MGEKWHQTLASEAGLTILLVSLVVVVFVIFPFVPLSGTGRLVVSLGLTAVLISGSFSLGDRPGLALTVRLLAGVSLISNWLRNFVASDWVDGCAFLSTILFLSLTSVALLAKVYRPGRVTTRRIQGAVAVYLMLGLIWGYAYALLELSSPGSFQTSVAEARSAEAVDDNMHDLVYFSFVTLTTLGYGDVTPIGAGARTLTMLEALVGQLYLVVLVARLVSLEVAHSGRTDP